MPPDNDMQGPRKPHYVFAHRALPEICHAHTGSFFNLMASDNRDDFLAGLWGQVETNVGERAQGYGPADIKVVTCLLLDRPVVFLMMPPPRMRTEAFMVGAVLAQPLAEGVKEEARYFALEYAPPLEGLAEQGDRQHTVFAEWTADGARHNYGWGPDPALREFFEAIEARLKQG